MTGMYHLLPRSSKGIMGAQPHLLFHQNPTLKAPPLSLSRIANPVYRQTVIFNRACHGTSCETLAPIGDNSHGSSPLCFRHACTLAGRQGIMKGAAAPGSLSPQKRGLKLEEAKGYHGVRFEVTQETSARGGQEQQAVASGSIHLIVGPMFAGKTTALLKRVQAEASTGRRVAMVKSDKDTRYGLAAIVSHDGMQMPCWAVPNLANFKAQIGEEAYAKLDLIGIDEAQFLKDLYSFCQVAADYEGKTLIVAGLDGDFQRNRFGSILDLVPLADSVVKLSSHCELCGKPAFFTFRKTDDRNKEVIGGTDIYMPVCRQHFLSGKIAMETARTVLDTHKFVSLQCDNVDRSINNVSGKD